MSVGAASVGAASVSAASVGAASVGAVSVGAASVAATGPSVPAPSLAGVLLALSLALASWAASPDLALAGCSAAFARAGFSVLPGAESFAVALPPFAAGSASLAAADLALPFGVAAPPSRVSLTAAAKISFLSSLGAAVFSVPSVPGRSLNFCQSPVISRIFFTGSVGCAPTDSQCCARSELTSMNEGSAFGWYLPISSIARPSRLVRASATTIL